MLISGIKSKPVYTTLEPDLSGKLHLLVGQGSGGDALLRLMRKLPDDADIELLYAAESLSGNDRSATLRELSLAKIHVVSAIADVLAELDRVLANRFMGTRLYAAGSESFLGSVGQVATKYNLNADEVQRELCGNATRRVYCIHCKTSQENVKTNIVKCAGCGRYLLVRDHYSRRLAAFMGVMADAEVPGELPPIEERFA